MASDRRFSVRVLRGMHVGAVAAFTEQDRCVIGSDTTCGIALLDEGVMAVHCVVYWKDGRLRCDALQGAVGNGTEQAGPGESIALRPGVPLQCGGAWILIERIAEEGHASSDDEDYEAQIAAAAEGRSGWHAVAARTLARAASPGGRGLRLASLGVFLALGLTGVAVAIASWDSEAYADPNALSEVQTWLRSVSPPGSELSARYDRETQRFAIGGYVATDYQGELLKRALRESRYLPRADFQSAEGLVNSFVRLVQLEKLLCVAEYAGQGKLRCGNEIANETTATRLRMLARQVPGVSDLELRMVPAAVAAAPRVEPPPPQMEKAEAPPPRWDGPRLGGKLSVWIWKKERFVLDWRGIKYRKGDLLDGMTIERISVDEIQVSRDGQPYSIVVASQ